MKALYLKVGSAHPRHLVELAQLLGHKTLNAVYLLQGSL